MEGITELKQYYIDDVLCITAKFDSRDLSYYVAYACFPKKYKDAVNQIERTEIYNITFFSTYGVPALINDLNVDDKSIQECNFYYLGTDTAHLIHWKSNSEATVKDFLNVIVKAVKEKAEKTENN